MALGPLYIHWVEGSKVGNRTEPYEGFKSSLDIVKPLGRHNNAQSSPYRHAYKKNLLLHPLPIIRTLDIQSQRPLNIIFKITVHPQHRYNKSTSRCLGISRSNNTFHYLRYQIPQSIKYSLCQKAITNPRLS